MRTLHLATLILATIGTGLLSAAVIAVGFVILPDSVAPAYANLAPALEEINRGLRHDIWFWVVVISGCLAIILAASAMLIKMWRYCRPLPRLGLFGAILTGLLIFGIGSTEHVSARMIASVPTELSTAPWAELSHLRMVLVLTVFTFLLYATALLRQIVQDTRGMKCA